MIKILIIEDEKILTEMYKDVFERAGFQADLVFSAEEAFFYLEKEKPNLILLDILLPRESGIDFLRKLRENRELSAIPVVALSNYDEPKIKNETLELGAKDYLMKANYTPRELVEKIQKFLE